MYATALRQAYAHQRNSRIRTCIEPFVFPLTIGTEMMIENSCITFCFKFE